jgi:thiol-disulfide isomerase/thioredoxin
MQQDADGSSKLCKHLDIQHFPTVVFFKSKQEVWRSHGSQNMFSDTSEGLLYFNESSKLHSADHVVEMTTVKEYDDFMAGSVAEKTADVKVVMLTTPLCSPCIHIYPCFVTLAMNFKGMIDFARLELDESTEAKALLRELRVFEVPTFLLFHKGKEVSRDVSSHRGDLIGHILQTAMKLGIQPPKPKKL